MPLSSPALVGDAKERVSMHARERDTIVRHIAEWMAQEHPEWGVDVLLTRPLDAIRLGLAVALKTRRITRGAAARAEQALECFQTDNTEALDAVAAVCRAAMCARKRGVLRSIKPTKGGQQE